MNIFLSSSSAKQSIQELDDLRLQKQLVEVYQLLTLAIKEQEEGKEIKAGHYHHPVYLFYRDNIPFLVYYGYIACQEYEYRFGKQHEMFGEFSIFLQTRYTEYVDCQNWKVIQPSYTPYYMEGSKGQPNYIRTTENVSELFRQKLIKKWEQDKAKGRQPKWTNREVPQFYQQWLKENGDERK